MPKVGGTEAKLARVRHALRDTLCGARAAGIAGAFALPLLLPHVASAHPGIIGFSGRPFNGSSDTCVLCHVGADTSNPPTLDVTAPATITAGQTGQVTLVVHGSRTRTSMNASFSDGVKGVAGSNTSIPIPLDEPNEVGAIVPPPNGASGTYTFSFVAPSANGPIGLWITGMSASGSGTGGDGIASTMKTITVVGGIDAPPPSSSTSSGDTSTGDGGVHATDPFGGASSSSAGSSAGGTTSSAGGTTDGGTSAGGAGTTSPSVDSTGGGCAVTPRDSGRDSGGGIFGLGMATAIAAITRARASRRRPRR